MPRPVRSQAGRGADVRDRVTGRDGVASRARLRRPLGAPPAREGRALGPEDGAAAAAPAGRRAARARQVVARGTASSALHGPFGLPLPCFQMLTTSISRARVAAT